MNHFSLKTFLIIFLFINISIISAQSNFYIFAMGGPNYIPMKNFSHWLNQFKNSKIDEFGFNGVVGLKYSNTENHLFLTSVEIINKNASYYGGFGGTTWNFKIIPISFGYQYLFSNKEKVIKPYLGLSVSYSFIEVEAEYSLDTPPPFDVISKFNRFSIEPNIGLFYEMSKRFSLSSEIKYRYFEDIEHTGQDVNLSGLLLNIGIQININAI